jgi:NitT/TauT family transport system substrate-binding protein
MVTNWFGQSSQAGFFAAKKNNRYADQNLDMTVDQGGPQVTGIPLVASGKYTFAMTSAEQVLLARAEGVPLVMVFTTFQRNPQGLMFHASHPVKDFPDLNGRKVYVSGAGTFWQVLTKKYNLDKVQQFQYNGQLATFLADEENVFQCFVTSEPVILKSQGKDVGYLVNADSGFDPYQNAMVCLEKTVKEQPDLVQAYVTASLQGWMDYVKEPQPILSFIKSDYAKELNLETESLTFAAERDGFYTGKGGWDPKAMGMLTDQRYKDLYDLMRSVNVLTKEVDYKTAFDASFVTKAHAALGV